MWFKHLVIPWLVLSVLYIGLYARVLRADLLETENEDYVRTARAKGLTERRVLLRHTLRTSMISFVSLFGLDFGVLVGGGALLVEVVFGLPGVGLLTYQSLISLDLPVIMATVIYGAIFIVIANAAGRRRPTPGSTRGCVRHERSAAARGARPERLVPHRGRHRARGGRRLVHRQPRRGAGHRGRVRLRQERDRDDADAADPRPKRRVLGRGAVQGARPDAAVTGRHAAGARRSRSR